MKEGYERTDGMFPRLDFAYDAARDIYICPNGRPLRTSGTVHDGRARNYLSHRTWKTLLTGYPKRASAQRYPLNGEHRAKDWRSFNLARHRGSEGAYRAARSDSNLVQERL